MVNLSVCQCERDLLSIVKGLQGFDIWYILKGLVHIWNRSLVR